MPEFTNVLRRAYSVDHQNYRYLDLLGMFWVTALLVSTFAASKLVAFGPFILPGTIVVYSVTYILSDVFTEVYGYRATRRIIWTGLCLLVFSQIVFWIISCLPAASGWNDQDAFSKIFGTAPLYATATIASYFSGEFTNSYTLAKLKIYTQGRWLWMRTIGSTMTGMVADNFVYVLIAYSFFYPLKDCLIMVGSGWIFCVLYEALATPVTYKIVNWLKQAEGVDIYDTETDFSPFHFMENSN
jgi:uncharacterized integral membrane protein (TIGR00697 family)